MAKARIASFTLHRANSDLLIGIERQCFDHVGVAEGKCPAPLPMDLLKASQLNRRQRGRHGLLNFRGHIGKFLALLLRRHLAKLLHPAARKAEHPESPIETISTDLLKARIIFAGI